LVARIEQTGIQGLVLFNRFYQIDIDTEKKKLVSAYQFSHPTELYPGLRWISILSGRETLEYSASTGVHDAQGAVKMLLAGASSVQLCSALYINKMERLEHILDGLSVWMDENEFESIADFQGSLRQAESTNPEQYERVQYIRALTGVS
jgi:dihydroorotate dehydrogenase (fumarate)